MHAEREAREEGKHRIVKKRQRPIRLAACGSGHRVRNLDAPARFVDGRCLSQIQYGCCAIWNLSFVGVPSCAVSFRAFHRQPSRRRKKRPPPSKSPIAPLNFLPAMRESANYWPIGPTGHGPQLLDMTTVNKIGISPSHGGPFQMGFFCGSRWEITQIGARGGYAASRVKKKRAQEWAVEGSSEWLKPNFFIL